MHDLSTPLTPLSFLDRSRRVFPNRVALIDEERRFTYAEMGDRVEAMADALLGLGVEPGDRVAWLAPNTAELVMAHFAVPLVGAVVTALNTRLAGTEIASILGRSGSRVLFLDPAVAPRVGATVGDHVETVVLLPLADGADADPALAPGSLSWSEFLTRAAGRPLTWRPTDEQDIIALNYTSGTNGAPKGVLYTHRGAALNALGQAHHQALTGTSVYLWTLPLFHCNGWCCAWACVAVGATQVCLRTVAAEPIWDKVHRHDVSTLCAAPTVLRMMATAPSDRPRTRHLSVTTAGAAPTPAIIRQMMDLKIDVTHVYGLTESYGPYTVCEPQREWERLPLQERAHLVARQGVDMLTADRIRVVTRVLDDVPADGVTVGEIVLRGNTVMAGYYEDPLATAEAFRGGWFHTGDLAVMHPDGYIQIVDRAKDVIITGGETVSSLEVERVLSEHPDVTEAAVVGHEDDHWGELIVAFVAGADAIEPEELIAFARLRLARYKVPKRIIVVPELPKTSTGKVRKDVLRRPDAEVLLAQPDALRGAA